ncbi:NAD(P)/FAD-dependent oxidoreductase [Humitalea sp. 24SJ18S-53]|uniref:NAD(P)/FAD-dependent oxidoreductase n=1 Tax=Humitalea sp. 24SJ18S-53 TaxID=3422307 RepID=UPI003D667858
MMQQTDRYDVAVLGGGMLGSAIAYGCAAGGARVAVLDEGDVALRAARGNFGLVWSQGKGDSMPAYAAWTRRSLAGWSDLAERMSGLAGRDVGYRAAGGLVFCLGEAELSARREQVLRQHNQGFDGVRILDRQALRDLMPGCPLGPEVIGASFQPADGHADPLTLLRGFKAGLLAAGAAMLNGAPVTRIIAEDQGFCIQRADGSAIHARRIVVASGLGTPALAAQIGLNVPVRPVRGQNIVTERLAPILPLPASALRQTTNGTIQIGVTSEDDGSYAPITRAENLATMAARAIRVIPALARANIVRTWGALRPMTPDGFPAYAESAVYPGAFVAVCHSAVTLAAVHAGPLAAGILAGRLPDELAPLHPRRFDEKDAHVPAH